MDSKSAKLLLEAHREFGEPSHKTLPAVSLGTPSSEAAPEDLAALCHRAQKLAHTPTYKLSKGSAQEAEHILEAASKIAAEMGEESPEEARELRIYLADFWTRQGDWDKALLLLEEELRRGEDPDVLSQVAEVFQKKGDLSQAAAFLESALSLSGGDPYLRRKLVEILDASGESQEALKTFQPFLDKAQASPWGLSELAFLLRRAGRDEEAGEVREKARLLYTTPQKEPWPTMRTGDIFAFFLSREPPSLEGWHRFFQNPPDDPATSLREGFALKSPEDILEASHGQVKLPCTYNWETRLPVRDGLFCAKIFGPLRDYECLCGKYQLLQDRGIVCEHCGVEVISSLVRLSRLGHIPLAAPVAHPWCYRGRPGWLALLLGIPQRDLEDVLAERSCLAVTRSYSSEHWRVPHISVSPHWDDYAEEVYQGPSGIKELLSTLDLSALAEMIRQGIQGLQSRQRSPRGRIAQRIAIEEERQALIEAFCETGKKPGWMFLEVLPVLPPEGPAPLSLEGQPCDRDAIQGAYLRILSINRLLASFLESGMAWQGVLPFVHELQSAVDALFDCFDETD